MYPSQTSIYWSPVVRTMRGIELDPIDRRAALDREETQGLHAPIPPMQREQENVGGSYGGGRI